MNVTIWGDVKVQFGVILIDLRRRSLSDLSDRLFRASRRQLKTVVSQANAFRFV